MESDRIHARAVIMREGVDREDAPGRRGRLARPGSPTAACPAITGVDTRALVRHIRDKGAMRGGIFAAERARSRGARARARPSRRWPAATSPGRSRAEPRSAILERRRPARGRDRHGHQALDRPQPARARACGSSCTRARAARRSCWRGDPDAVFLANGPGDPAALDYVVETVAAGRQGAGLRHLPRPSAALPGGRPRDLQAPVRPPRRATTRSRT